MTDADTTSKQAQLDSMKKQTDKALKADGLSKGHMKSQAFMLEVFDYMELFYNNGSSRLEAFHAGIKTEEIRSNYATNASK